jgi:hypothetical protein
VVWRAHRIRGQEGRGRLAGAERRLTGLACGLLVRSVSPALSDLSARKVTRVLESVGFAYVRTKAVMRCMGTGRGVWPSSLCTAS